jgi:hypothetical protein
MYILKFNDCNFYLKYLITSKARITAFVINVPGFISSSPIIISNSMAFRAISD